MHLRSVGLTGIIGHLCEVCGPQRGRLRHIIDHAIGARVEHLRNDENDGDGKDTDQSDGDDDDKGKGNDKSDGDDDDNDNVNGIDNNNGNGISNCKGEGNNDDLLDLRKALDHPTVARVTGAPEPILLSSTVGLYHQHHKLEAFVIVEARLSVNIEGLIASNAGSGVGEAQARVACVVKEGIGRGRGMV
jgi:hypothetical protein